jgi:hypothetical protein
LKNQEAKGADLEMSDDRVFIDRLPGFLLAFVVVLHPRDQAVELAFDPA